jgi:hypothetical protein
MSVYVINQRKELLMPTTAQKARKLLKENKAKVIKRTPFTIQLLTATGETKQDIILGIDAGSKTIGLSATTDKKELYSAEVVLRNDIIDLLSTRRQNRRTRRNRLRYREAKFLNRVSTKKEGWLEEWFPEKLKTGAKKGHIGYNSNSFKLTDLSEIKSALNPKMVTIPICRLK